MSVKGEWPREAARQKLPNRRLRLVDTFATAAGIEVLAELGFDEEGVVREIFCEGYKPGSDMQVLLADACILISKYLLQAGRTPEELLATLMRTDLQRAADAYRDAETGVARPSLIAMLLMRAVERGLTDQASVVEAYAAARRLDVFHPHHHERKDTP